MPIKHLFLGKKCFIDRALADRSQLESALKTKNLNPKNILFINQIHSAEILVVDDIKKIHGIQNLPKVDAIVTNLSSLAIAVVTADCSPILLQDAKANIIAAIHAGWRGAKANIIAAAVVEMKKLGANPQEIRADIGPMIHQDSYQVSAEFFDDFILEDVQNAKFFIKDKSSPAHYLFDLPAFVVEKLRQQKITNISNSSIDTYKNENYSSYRRATHQGLSEGGRNISLIMIDG